jgi:hypothetical protein
MKKNRFSLPVLILFISTSYLFSQGAYLEKGKSGLGVALGYSSNKDISGFMGGLGYSVLGTFDFGISIGQLFNKQKLEGFDFSAIVVSPSIAFYPLKQDSTTPISFSLSFSYESDSYSSEALGDMKMYGSYISSGVSIYRNIILSPTINLQPSFGIAYITGQLKIENDFQHSILSDTDELVYAFDIELIFKKDQSTLISITPGIAFVKNTTTFALSAQFITVLGK